MTEDTKMKLTRVSLDAMGGDNPPTVNIDGTLQALNTDSTLEVMLVGDEAAISRGLDGRSHPRLSTIHASQVVAMDEAPAVAVKSRPDNSMSVGIRLLKENRADAFVTTGNTGAALAASLFELGRIRGIRRPALAAILPGLDGQYLVLDVGANADCRPQDLLQFALMGHVYSRMILGLSSPRIGLLSNGEEEGKGNELVKEAFPMLKASGLNFVGNVEGKDLPHNLVDVVVTDGFTGNVLIKTAEGTASLILDTIRGLAKQDLRSKVGGLLLRPALRRSLAKLDYTEVGGAPLLGVNGVVLVGHGRSNARAVENLILAGKRVAKQALVKEISTGLEDILATGKANA